MRRGVTSALVAFPAFLWLASAASGEDWPQWMGPTRNNRVSGFTVPKEWPKELKKRWQVKVGDGVATPALVGDRLYVFSREGNNEVVRCLEAATGKEVWVEKYESRFSSGGGDSGFPGPRSSPAVAEGKVVTFGVNGVLSCLSAADGKKVWRIDNTGEVDRFHTSSSPLITDGVAVAQVGNDRRGGVVAHDLATGKEKWKWTDEGTGFASLTLMTVDGTKMVVALASRSVVGLSVADGKLLWSVPFPYNRGPGSYNASTPVPNGSTLVFSGSSRGTKAVKVEKTASGFTAKELWSNKEYSVVYNTPVVGGGLVYGLTGRNTLYAVNADTGKNAWDYNLPSSGKGGFGGKGKGGGGGGSGYGNIVDAGPVLMAITPAGKLYVFEPNKDEYKEVAAYAVGSRTYAFPIVSGNRIFIKDSDSVTLYTVE